MSNRLSGEASPYLKQHADNPVDWQPWDDAALADARDNDKPILLSVGYSACHWCHVMAHESFEDPETARLMNDLYVNVKVDREERPDIDRIYQAAQQMFTGRPGGWPLTVFLTPDTHLPIFAGTYFPKTANYGMPAFSTVLTRVESYYRTHGDEVAANGQRILEQFGRLDARGDADGVELTGDPIANARQNLVEVFDAHYGGFGTAPKFPHPSYLDFLLAGAHPADAARATGTNRIVTVTLDAMAGGGLYDHINGGFFRYCVDREWQIPHFEKMLYDNAALLGTYADAFAATGQSDYARIAEETARWLVDEMQAPDGAFYATLDADSEGEEGRYYVFTAEEIDAALEAEDEFARRAFGFSGPPNFEAQAWHAQTRSRDPWRSADASESAELERARRALRALRETRVRPGLDDKILTGWNGLAIASLAKAGRRLGRPELVAQARRACDFVRERLWDGERLSAVFAADEARFTAYLDDYTFVLAGVIELLQADFQPAELAFARSLAETVMRHYRDPAGGFFFTADDHEQLIHRPRPLTDDATPSGNATLAIALNTLGHLLADSDYLDAAANSVRAAWRAIASYPEAHATYLLALGRQLAPPELIIVRADPPALAEWRTALDGGFAPGRLAFFIDAAESALPAGLARHAAGSGPRAYVCVGTACHAPVTSIAELETLLGSKPDSPVERQ